MSHEDLGVHPLKSPVNIHTLLDCLVQVIDPTQPQVDEQPQAAAHDIPDQSHLSQDYRDQPDLDENTLSDDDQITEPDAEEMINDNDDDDDDPNTWLADPPPGEAQVMVINSAQLYSAASAAFMHALVKRFILG